MYYSRLSYIAVTTFTSFPMWSRGNCLLAGAQVLSMLLNTSSSRGDAWSAEEYTRPRGTLNRTTRSKWDYSRTWIFQSKINRSICQPYPSAVDNSMTRMPPPEALDRSMINCSVCCKLLGSRSTVLAIAVDDMWFLSINTTVFHCPTPPVEWMLWSEMKETPTSASRNKRRLLRVARNSILSDLFYALFQNPTLFIYCNTVPDAR